MLESWSPQRSAANDLCHGHTRPRTAGPAGHRPSPHLRPFLAIPPRHPLRTRCNAAAHTAAACPGRGARADARPRGRSEVDIPGRGRRGQGRAAASDLPPLRGRSLRRGGHPARPRHSRRKGQVRAEHGTPACLAPADRRGAAERDAPPRLLHAHTCQIRPLLAHRPALAPPACAPGRSVLPPPPAHRTHLPRAPEAAPAPRVRALHLLHRRPLAPAHHALDTDFPTPPAPPLAVHAPLHGLSRRVRGAALLVLGRSPPRAGPSLQRGPRRRDRPRGPAGALTQCGVARKQVSWAREEVRTLSYCKRTVSTSLCVSRLLHFSLLFACN